MHESGNSSPTNELYFVPTEQKSIEKRNFNDPTWQPSWLMIPGLRIGLNNIFEYFDGER